MIEPVSTGAALTALGQMTGAALLAGSVVNSWNSKRIADANRRMQMEIAEKNRQTQYDQMALQDLISKRSCEETRRNIGVQLRFQAEEAEKSRAFTQAENALSRAAQLEIAEMSSATSRDEGAANRNLNAYMFYIQRLESRWPLRIDPMQFIEWPTDRRLAPDFDFQPLRVLVAPPTTSGSEDAALVRVVQAATSGALRTFAARFYPYADSERPVEFLDGAWNPSFCGGAAINTLFNVMRRTPTLILETQINGDFIDLSFAYWSGLTTRYQRANVFRIDAPTLIAALCREEAKQQTEMWRRVCAATSKEDKKAPDKSLFASNVAEANGLLYLLEESLMSNPGDYDSLGLFRRYAITKDVERRLLWSVGSILSVYFSLFADIHHLMSRASKPVLPTVFPSFNKYFQGVPGLKPSPDFLLRMYENAYERTLADTPSVVARIEYAGVLARFGAREEAKEELRQALGTICKALGIERTDDLERDARVVFQNARLLNDEGRAAQAALKETLSVLRSNGGDANELSTR